MDINMKEIKLVKPDGQKWIFISEDGITPTTKLMYWDGVQNTKCYKQSFIDIAVDSKFDYYGDMLGTADY